MLPLRVSARINPKLTGLQGLPMDWPFLLSLVPLGQDSRARSPSKPSEHPKLEGTHEVHHIQLLATQRTTRKPNPTSESIAQMLLEPQEAPGHGHFPGEPSQRALPRWYPAQPTHHTHLRLSHWGAQSQDTARTQCVSSCAQKRCFRAPQSGR